MKSLALARRFALLAALVAGGLAAPLQAANVVANGDFSANAAAFVTWPGYLSPQTPTNPATIDNWTHSTGGSAGINGSGTSFFAAQGEPFGPTSTVGVDNFLFMQGIDVAFGFNLFSQTIVLDLNTTYNISWAAASRSGNAATGRVQVGDTSVEIYNSGNTAWADTSFTTFNDTFTTGSSFTGAVSVQLYNFTAGEQTTAYSYIFIEAVPEPGSGALLTGALRRRR